MPLHIKGLDFVKVKKDCEDFHLNYHVRTIFSYIFCGEALLHGWLTVLYLKILLSNLVAFLLLS